MKRIKTERLQVITNYQERDIIYWQDLTEEEREEYDWRETEEQQQEFEGFRYRGYAYDLADFTRVSPGSIEAQAGWQGVKGDSFFSGILVAYNDDLDGIIAGLELC